MRNYVKRGSVSSRIDYAKLREDVWNEVYSLDKEGIVLHDNDIQNIAMVKAKERNLQNFTVCNMKHNLFAMFIVKFDFLLSRLYRPVTDGCITLKKNTALLIVTLIRFALQDQLMMIMNWIIWLLNSKRNKFPSSWHMLQIRYCWSQHKYLCIIFK